jgi:hypothetical protein
LLLGIRISILYSMRNAAHATPLMQHHPMQPFSPVYSSPIGYRAIGADIVCYSHSSTRSTVPFFFRNRPCVSSETWRCSCLWVCMLCGGSGGSSALSNRPPWWRDFSRFRVMGSMCLGVFWPSASMHMLQHAVSALNVLVFAFAGSVFLPAFFQ